MGIFSDYPHYYSLTKEGTEDTVLYATRISENGDFIISKMKDIFCLYGPNFIALMKPNILGTKFDVYDCGMDINLLKLLPKDFIPK